MEKATIAAPVVEVYYLQVTSDLKRLPHPLVWRHKGTLPELLKIFYVDILLAKRRDQKNRILKKDITTIDQLVIALNEAYQITNTADTGKRSVKIAPPKTDD